MCYSNTNVKLVGLNAGVCYGPLASTHHAIDDISIMGGLGSIVAEIIAGQGIKTEFTKLGIPAGEFSKAGPGNEIRAYYKIDRAGIVETARGL